MNEDALLRVLEEGRIKGVALDVYDEEPLPLEHPLRKARGVVLTPHLGYAGDSTFKVCWGFTFDFGFPRCFPVPFDGPSVLLWKINAEGFAGLLMLAPNRRSGVRRLRMLLRTLIATPRD